MSEENLSIKAKEALKHLRNFIMQHGRMPSTRELMKEMNYKSPLSPMLLLNELAASGFLKKKADGGYTLIKDLTEGESARTVAVPLVGTVTCGSPILAQENIEAMIPVSTRLVKHGSKYFLLRAKGDSMNEAGINDGDLILIKQQLTANNGDKVVALIDDEATVKEYQYKGHFVTLMPRSKNKDLQPIILTHDFQIQGVVVATIPK
ncbi:MAG: transcriptional repressor LexA [Niabella sp.]